MSNRRPRKVNTLPSVTELIDRVVADLERRRPENWRSIVREQWNRNLVPCVRLSNVWEGDIPPGGVLPFRGEKLDAEETDGKGADKNFETILDIDYASEIAVKFSTDPGWRIHGKQPNMNAIGNLERTAKSVPLLNRKKRIV